MTEAGIEALRARLRTHPLDLDASDALEAADAIDQLVRERHESQLEENALRQTIRSMSMSYESAHEMLGKAMVKRDEMKLKLRRALKLLGSTRFEAVEPESARLALLKECGR